MALLYFMDSVVASFEKQEYTIGIFLDFSKAFDTVNHEILLNKLDHYGIRGVTNKCVRSYLDNRKQFCTYNDYKSETMTMTCGVPQGSILGPLLFLIYINDLGTISEDIESILFADDSNLFAHGKKLEDAAETLNNALPKILDWLRANRLSLNIDKTHYMIFSPTNKDTPKIDITIDGNTINETKECKFLGIIVDHKLNWKSHIESTSKKVAKSVGILCKARKYLPP